MDQVQDEEHNQLNTTQNKSCCALILSSAGAPCHGAPFQTSTNWKLCPPYPQDYRSSTPYIISFYHPQTQLQSCLADNLKSGKNCQMCQIHFRFQNSLLSPLAYQQHLLMAISMRAISDGSSFCLSRTSWEHATAGEKGERKGDIRVRTWLNIGISAN